VIRAELLERGLVGLQHGDAEGLDRRGDRCVVLFLAVRQRGGGKAQRDRREKSRGSHGAAIGLHCFLHYSFAGWPGDGAFGLIQGGC